MNTLAKSLIIAGILIALLGVGIIIFSRFRIPFLGKLPGDILIRREHFTFYFPIATSIVLSLIVSAIFWFVLRFHK
ncbi:MAG: DUF2905 domain-containing protein [Candidatus Omnitrophota bacterium]